MHVSRCFRTNFGPNSKCEACLEFQFLPYFSSFVSKRSRETIARYVFVSSQILFTYQISKMNLMINLAFQSSNIFSQEVHFQIGWFLGKIWFTGHKQSLQKSSNSIGVSWSFWPHYMWDSKHTQNLPKNVCLPASREEFSVK